MGEELKNGKVENKRMKVNEKALNFYKTKVGSKTIFKGVVSMVEFSKKLNSEILVVNLKGIKGIIKKEDVDLELNIPYLSNFVGREVSFVIKSLDEKNGVLYCSRKEAQAITKDIIIERLKDGEAFIGQIINILPHGAYIEIEGVTGLLKNTDFAEDFTKISDKYSQGDKISVKFKKFSKNNEMLFEATKKYCDPATINPEDLAVGQTIIGVVRSIKPFGIFVNIAAYLDILCPVDVDEYEEDQKVQVLIEDIQEKEFNGVLIKRYKGKIKRVLN